MRPAHFLNALGAVSVLQAPVLASSISVSDVVRRSLAAFAKRDVASEILSDIENLVDCPACESLLVVLKVVAAFGNKAFVSVITDVCKSLKLEDPDVCTGAIGLEAPILAHDLRQMTVGTKTSKLFCLTIFGLCPWPAVDTSYAPSLTAKPAKTRPSPSGKQPLKVVHISDIHVDLSYQTGASYNCTKPICCRPYTAADAPENTSYPAGPFGNPGCDSPLTLEESMYSAIKSLVPDRAFTIFTGDLVEGAVWLVTETEVTNDINDAYTRMQGLGTVYAVTGNHESAPVNSFPPLAVSTDMSSQWVYNALSKNWAGWIGSAGASQASSNYGSYSYVDKSGLRIISVNTNFWYKQNFWLYERTMEHDPSGMFAWLVSELQVAESAGQRAWIIGHMPMGTTDTFHDASYYFDLIVQRFEGTIAGVFCGHTHKDEFEIAYSNYANQAASTATMMTYIAPALTPRSGNPTFRVYDIDPVTFGVLDFTVYSADLNSPTFQSSPTWSKLYSAKEAYGAPLGVTDPSAELTPAFWHNVTALFQTDDAIFQQYHERKLHGGDGSSSSCTGDCKTAEICQLRAAQAQYNCGVIKPGVNFRRDASSASGTAGGATTAAGGGECEGSRALPILAAMSGRTGIDALREAMVGALGESVLSAEVPANYTVDGAAYWKL